jgi:hypothetical protein
MPWTPAQHRLFAAAAHDPDIAARKGLDQAQARRMAAEGIKTHAYKQTRRKALLGALRGR